MGANFKINYVVFNNPRSDHFSVNMPVLGLPNKEQGRLIGPLAQISSFAAHMLECPHFLSITFHFLG